MKKKKAHSFLGPRGYPQADILLNDGQKWFVAFLLIAVVAVGTLQGGAVFLYLNIAFTILFLASTLYRFFLVDLSLKQQGEIFIHADELQPPNGEWPRYVIQVPLYRERSALPHLVAALSKLDYPKDRLTVQLLIEEDDTDTIEALEKITIEPPFTVVNIPVIYPRTKPKACNVGLAEAEGDYLVIYDAEDRPDPDQLKKAAVAFTRCSPQTACIQAKLNFYNTNRNLLTRCFTAEYAMWFDLCLPGLDHLQAPIPLGGTSNHFRLNILKELKGWDEYNVTEDCDLGLRLFLNGWQTRILDSTTWEEACPVVGMWIRQRSRWVKGYVQTYIVHTRDFFDLSRRLGVLNSIHFHLLIGGSVLSQLLSLFYWIMVCVWIAFRPEAFQEFYPGPVFVMAALCLFAGNFVLAYCCAIACLRRRLGSVVKFTILMPFYWMVMAIAAWKGTLQLLWNPHYWEKTMHLE